ncbi:MAG: ABC transporter permease [Saprospiraceae bacterium]|nr:ABC transporter permease [Saprospiraceae bacterium]MCF8251499.1 ABC transporter permease [Saprospiraceae bacterium]MCF8280749.1 ABC transporter permease [Bacteroidales bacterium]MCF8313359.1 ABC transporter permease [Saprospiraceae bacterium]MCF8441821.1 ABC transporter permease [Saprospiraceae bacterium]
MFFQKKANKLAEQATLAQSPWSLVRRRFRKRRLALWSWRVLLVLGFVALFGDFIANEKPLYCKLGGEAFFPVLKQYAVDMGFAKWNPIFLQKSWDEHEYEAVVFPIIPYSSSSLDLKNNNYRSPFGQQTLKSWRWRHWLGTDQSGRDVAAGMVAGTRVALLVGIISMGIATLIGLLLGSLAGYFGDDRMWVSWPGLVLNLLAAFFAWFYGFKARGFTLSEAAKQGGLGGELLKSLAIVALVFLVANGLSALFNKFVQTRKITLPLDLLIMRAIEVMNSIPGLLLLLALVAVLEKSSISYVMAIIGLLRWTSIARYLRAELLKIRNLGYIEAARAMAFPNRRILLRHALPNAIGPVLITVAFGVASAILLESTLSFLGIGLGAEGLTWGSLLKMARQNHSAWWLAVFPGAAIFVTVTIFNLIGDGLSEAMGER